ncbi:unnamed protein product [Chilo suppressalis]|uniref:Centromere protein X n=1 Tax=Chilo suppressalis TaxID=168631 RepID=A0ABN8AYE9_CHISP|nr:unnamed protein product [Chilo suppressalis]
MYRQIVVRPSDRCLQQILWRDDVKLNTVTYGTVSAPFLATRCLMQIGLDCTNQTVTEIIKHDFYVDDLLTGGDNLSSMQGIRNDITDALASAGMTLRKWLSNEPQLVLDSSNSSLNLNIGSDEPNKLLGLGWQSSTDKLCFPIHLSLPNSKTKRDLLSLHIFTDASESAYGACVYVRSVDVSGVVMVRLLMAKSRVAPIKPTRLELCGALVGARLFVLVFFNSFSTMARNCNENDDDKIDPASVTANVKSSIKQEVIKDLLNGSFQDNKTKLGNDALSLVVEVAKCLVTETCLRASNQALRESCDRVELEHVEKCLPQLMLDFP